MDAAAEALLDLLPEPAAIAMRAAFEKHRGTYEFTEHFYEACKAVGYPMGHHPPLASELTSPQRALAQLVVDEPFDAPSHIPTTVGTRRRWLGLDPPRVLEQMVRFTDPHGKQRETPLWYALHVLPRTTDEPSRDSLMRKFPVDTRLRVLTEVGEDWRSGYSVDAYDVFSDKPQDLDQLQGEGVDWLPAFADLLVSRPRDLDHYRFPIFLALVRAKVPIKPGWDKLVPVSPWPPQRPYMIEAARAIPESRREAALVAAIEAGLWRVATAGILYAAFPSPGLIEVIKKALPYANGAEKKFGKETLAKAGIAMKPTKQVVVTCVRAVKPKTLGDLSKSQHAQLAKAGKLYDGQNVPAARRLSQDKEDEQNFASTLEVRELVDAKGKLVYQAYTYNGDSGTVFKVGTTTVVAEIVQGGMECKNEALGEALDAALEAKPNPTKPVTAKKRQLGPKKKPVGKKAAKRK